jgi:uncharacterized SAM-binding protein YcdF (DUF218 family)
MSVSFQALLMRLYDWLNCSDPVGHAELIFALAGRESRKVFALELFSQERAPRLLLSVGRFEIRRFARLPPVPAPLDLLQIAATVSPPDRHFFVSFNNGEVEVGLVPRGRFGTLSEIRALSSWLNEHRDVSSVLVVSSATHLRRVRMCCRALLPRRIEILVLGVPNEHPYLRRDRWWQNPTAKAMVLSEPMKLLGYRIVLPLHRAIGC